MFFVTISEGKVKGKDPDAHKGESERYFLGAGKIVVINRRRSEYKKSNKVRVARTQARVETEKSNKHNTQIRR